jgi:riboflavin kinase/FMN adenylyltransferase
VVCIGAFDGLHRGHQALVGHARARAAALGLPLVALSFEPLPREYFARGERPARLTLPRAKFEGLRALGADLVGLLRFGAALSSMPAEAFAEQILAQRLSAREVWVGPDFRYGQGRGGPHPSLRESGDAARLCRRRDRAGDRRRRARVELAPARTARDRRPGGAAEGLGRRYAIDGKVVRGRQLGRRLGFPTANLRLMGKRTALTGIYATWVHGVGELPRASVSSLGTRPTVFGTEPLLEAHLFDFDGDLYGRRLRVEFVAKLRDEEKFDDLPALVRQMNLDAVQARKLLRQDRNSTRSVA